VRAGGAEPGGEGEGAAGYVVGAALFAGWAEQGEEEGLGQGFLADVGPGSERGFDSVNDKQGFRTGPGAGVVVVSGVPLSLGLNESAGDGEQMAEDRPCRVRGRGLAERSFAFGALVLGGGLHLAMCEIAREGRSKLRLFPIECGFVKQEVEERVVGSGHRAAKAGLPGPFPLPIGEVKGLFEELVVVPHKFTPSGDLCPSSRPSPTGCGS